MPDIDESRLWLQPKLASIATQRAVQIAEDAGRVWPCHVVAVAGQMVTVAFDVNVPDVVMPTLVVPKLESPYVMTPTQAGDRGIVISASVLLNQATGASAQVPQPGFVGNLSALAFLPIAQVTQTLTPSGVVIVSGPDGVTLRTQDGSISIALSSSGITINGDVNVNGTVTSNGVVLSTHTHSDVEPGTGISGPPTP